MQQKIHSPRESLEQAMRIKAMNGYPYSVAVVASGTSSEFSRV